MKGATGMINVLAANIGNIVIIAVLIAIVVAAVRSVLKKKGKCSCGCDCGACGSEGSCHCEK